ncbi:MAG: NADH-quinone oxidoreductase subunit A [Candidatus Methylomirabilia bacterium]
MDFYYLSFIMLAAVLFVLFAFTLSRLVAPSQPGGAKAFPYECGEVPLGSAWTRFNVGYYVFALLFLLFEVEVVFLFPWAVVLKEIGVPALVEGGVFLVILVFGFAFAWRKGYLAWR